MNEKADTTLASLRRAVVRPLGESAAGRLRLEELPPADQVEVYRIPEVAFEKHFALFNDLHRVCGVAGDDFTVEEIEPERLENVLKMLKTYPRRDSAGKLDTGLDDLLDRLWGLCWRANQAGMPVFAVL